MRKSSPDLSTAEILEGKQLLAYEFERQAAEKIDVSVDLIAAAKRQLSFLRAVQCVPGLHRGPAVLIAIQRYYKCWMPLAAAQHEKRVKQGDWEKTALLPPFDVQWVWHCHRLNPVAYRHFCTAKYQKVIDFPVLGSESETAARERCRALWSNLYPKEPFDVLPQVRKLATGQVYPIEEQSDDEEEYDLVLAIARQSSFYFQVSQPYVWEEPFLRVALHRYKCFLHILRKSEGKILCVPTYDIDLIWHAHQLSPVSYANDTEALLGCLMDHDDTMEKGPNTELGNGFQDTIHLWEKTFGLPYERAGAMPRGTQALGPTPLPADNGGFERVPLALPWDYHPRNVNLNLKALSPRFVVEACILVRSAVAVVPINKAPDLFFRLRVQGAHKLMKLDAPFVPTTNQQLQWQKLWLLQCDVGTKGLVLELRKHSKSCFNSLSVTKLLGQTILTWQELEESPMLSINRVLALKHRRRKKLLKQDFAPSCRAQIKFGASITPPVPAPYLLKSVPDRVTDNSGQMISTIFLKLAKNRPQEGRWMSRTVLNHSGNECFVIRIRAAKGIWRKGGDRPVGVDWNERVIHICEGGWSYISDFIGIAPAKVVASATPIADDIGQYKLKWSFSSGEILTISRSMDEQNWERNLNFDLESATYGLARLLNGRKLAYEVPGARLEDEEGFVTMVRHAPDAPQGKATALFNWKVSAMEVHPEEDVLLVLLLCTATLRSVADLGGTNYGNLFARRRAKEVKPGVKDWGSVVLENAKSQSNLLLWYVNTGHLLDSKDREGSSKGSSTSSSEGSACGSGFSRGMSEWEGGKSFAEQAEHSSSIAGFGGGIGGRQERRTGSGCRLDNFL